MDTRAKKYSAKHIRAVSPLRKNATKVNLTYLRIFALLSFHTLVLYFVVETDCTETYLIFVTGATGIPV